MPRKTRKNALAVLLSKTGHCKAVRFKMQKKKKLLEYFNDTG